MQREQGLKVGDRVVTVVSEAPHYDQGWVGVITHKANSYVPHRVEFDNGKTSWVREGHLEIHKEEENVMNQNVENPLTAKEAVSAWLDGKEVEYYLSSNGCWFTLSSITYLSVLKREDTIYRIKPKPKKQYKVFDVLFDEDELPQKELTDGTVYFYMDSFGGIDDNIYSNRSEVDKFRIKHKNAFLTKESCEKWYKALAEYDLTSCVVEG